MVDPEEHHEVIVAWGLRKETTPFLQSAAARWTFFLEISRKSE